jgi:hypothetical protein
MRVTDFLENRETPEIGSGRGWIEDYGNVDPGGEDDEADDREDGDRPQPDNSGVRSFLIRLPGYREGETLP